MSYQPPQGGQWPDPGQGYPPPPPPPPGYPQAPYSGPYNAPYGAPGMGQSYAAPMPPKTSGLAITSMVSGIVGLCLLGAIAGIVAVITGHMALSQIKNSAGAVTGRGMAIAGLILGYLEIAVTIIVVILILSGALNGALSTPPAQ